MKIKKPTEFLCKKCLIKFREYDATRRKRWRKERKVELGFNNKIKN